MNDIIQNQTAEKPFYKSKKFWYAIAVGAAASAKELGVEIPPEALYAGMALILGQGLADLSKNTQKQTLETAAEATVSTIAAQTAQPSVPAEGQAIPEVVELFDVRAFDQAVIQRAKEVYGEATAGHKFFAAKELGMVTRVSHIDQSLDYWNYLVSLADGAFSETWGYGIDEAQKRVSEPGCPNRKEGCGGYTNLKTKAGFLGPEFYGSYLDLERAKATLSEIQTVKAKGVNWKSKLYPQNHTLYHLGEMAKYLL